MLPWLPAAGQTPAFGLKLLRRSLKYDVNETDGNGNAPIPPALTYRSFR